MLKFLNAYQIQTLYPTEQDTINHEQLQDRFVQYIEEIEIEGIDPTPEGFVTYMKDIAHKPISVETARSIFNGAGKFTKKNKTKKTKKTTKQSKKSKTKKTKK